MSKIELGTYLTGDLERYHDAIEACIQCFIACEVCAGSCLREEDIEMMAECIRTDLDCAAACRAAASAMARGSSSVTYFVQLCVEACERCAESCAEHDHDHCQRCAEACRRCAEACRQLAN